METQLALQEVKGKIEELHEIVNKLIIAEMPRNKKGEIVIEKVLDYAGMNMEQLTDSRKSGLIFYKRILSYLLHDYCHWTLKNIAVSLRLTHHATILNHVNKMRWWMAHPQYAPYDIITATRNILNMLGYEKD